MWLLFWLLNYTLRIFVLLVIDNYGTDCINLSITENHVSSYVQSIYLKCVIHQFYLPVLTNPSDHGCLQPGP